VRETLDKKEQQTQGKKNIFEIITKTLLFIVTNYDPWIQTFKLISDEEIYTINVWDTLQFIDLKCAIGIYFFKHFSNNE
jgi:hypothetical protein